MGKYYVTFCFMLLTVFFYGQKDWKEILQKNEFEIVENKNKVPPSIFRKIKMGDISKIANPNKEWNSSCTQSKSDDSPTAKLNWAATDNRNWIISITTGGYMVMTNYFLIAKGLPIEQITMEEWEGLNFATFKSKYLDRSAVKSEINVD